MASDDERQGNRFHDLESIKSVLLAPDGPQGDAIKDRMIDVGLRGIGACQDAAQLPERITEHQPDLLVLDLDDDRKAICRVVQDIRSQAIKTDNPFVVVVGVTDDGSRETVAAALEAGLDALLAKPVAASALRACLREQVENRADFIATADYVGPDRRPESREASDEELVSVEVPNTLHQKATGETDPEPVEARIAQTLRSLGAQRAWHLAHKIARLSENARRAMESGADYPLLGDCIEAIEANLTRIEALDSEFDLSNLRPVIASAREALQALVAAGNTVGARHFELLRVHSESLGLAMEQDETIRDVLVTELARAVNAVREDDGTADDGGAGMPRDRGFSWRVRLRAWWEGVEPRDIAAAGASEARP